MKPERKFKPLFWLRLVVFAAVLTYLAMVLISALGITTMLTIPLKGSVCCLPPGGILGVQPQDISLQTADGLTLAGWYFPSRNGAVVILLHSYYANRVQPLPVAEMLIRHGYGVVTYDQRASGESQGEVRTLGWLDIPDVNQAVRFAQSRPGVDRDRVGVYGCSVGGAIAVAAAAANPSIAAVAVDAPSPITFEESRPTFADPAWGVNIPIYALYHSFLVVRAGAFPPTTTRQAVQAITPRPLLLISTGETAERAYVSTLYELAGQPKQQRNIPQATHCGAPHARPAEYEQALIDFFKSALP